jgi:nucleoside-diphosphate-sugar epimerase
VEYPLQLLDAARTARIGMFINAGTSLVPELGAYALTKHQFAQWGRQIAAASPIGFINVRLEHLYGPGDGPGKLVTYLIGMCLDNRPEIPLTTGEQKRDFIFIHDAVAAFLELIRAAPRIGGGFHEFPVGSGRSITIRQLAEDIHRMTASTSSLRFGAIPYRPHEPMESRADLSAIRHLGWSPATPLEAGLRSTIAAAIAERHAPDSARPGNARR